MHYQSSHTFRKHTRSKTRKRVRLVNNDRVEIYAVTRDISETGLLIDRSGLLEVPSVGEQWIVDFYSVKGLPKKATVKVVRENADGIAFLFN